MEEDDKDYLINRMEDLIKSIKSALGLTEEAISRRIGYNEGYISQTRSRGSVSKRFIDNLEREFRTELQNANFAKRSFMEERKEQKMTISTFLVPLVPIKAQAGYVRSHDLVDFIDQLDKYPMAPGLNPRGADWRWFEVEGESMEPKLYSGDYVLASSVPAVDWLENLEETYIYVFVTNRRLIIKRARLKGGKWIMYSDNDPAEVPIDFGEVREIWKVRRQLNARLSDDRKIVITEKRKNNKK